MAIENINAYSERWQNGVSVGAMWDKIKAKFVSGAHDQTGATAYPNTWKVQARVNLGLGNLAENSIWIGASGNKIAQLTTTEFGRTLLNTTSNTRIVGLFADKAYRLDQASVGSLSLPVYVDSNGRVATITSLAVSGNVQSLQGGVSAMGIADLFSSVGGGGGGGTVTGVDFTQDVAYQQTGTYTPDDGIIHLPRYKWANIQDKPIVTTGSVNGTISYGGNNVAVYGLQALAYKASLTASDIPTIAISQVNGLQTALNNKLETSLKGAANGLAELDASQKIKLAQIPDVVLGQLVFGGTVNASGVATLSANAKTKTGITSNTVTLSNSAGTSSSYGWVRFEGCFFIMDADSSFASLDLKVGDWLLSTGTAWKKVDNTDAVTGVKGDNESSYRIGNVNITKANIGLGNVENTALSTWAGTQNITTLGTITTGVWHGTKIANDYLVNSTIYINGTSFALGDSATQDKVTAIWGASRDITISDNDGTNTQVTEDVNGSNNFTLKLPSTIKATLTGNASSATKLQTSRNIWGQPFNGTAEVSGNMSSVGNIAFNAGDHNIGSLLYFDMTNGRIGIGMSAPLEKLGVQGNMYATGGVAAYGISDLSQSGGGGGGLSGTILRDWSQYDGSAEANQILSSYLGIEQFRMSGQNFQFMRNKTWTTGFTLAEGNIPDLAIGKITGVQSLTIKGGTTSIGTYSPSSALEVSIVAGTNISVTPDATNHKITIANTYSLPTASSSTKGGVKVGSGLTISNEVLSVSGVTNDMLSGSIANGKLASLGKFTIGSQAIELGQTYTQANFRSYLGLGTAATHAHGDYLTDLGTSGKTLTWSKGGAAQDALTIPYAKQSTTLETEPLTNQEFIFRNSPKTIGADSLKLDRILGRTLVWNQIYVNSRTSGSSFAGITFIRIDNYSFYYSGTASQTQNITQTLLCVSGHKYYVGCSNATEGIYVNDENVSATSKIITANGTVAFGVLFESGKTYSSAKVYRPLCIDLTLFFNGNIPEGLTAETFERDYGYLLANPEYNEGQLINNSAKGLETVGFNLYGSKLEFGNLAPYPEGTSSNYIRTTEYVSAFSGQYYFNWRNVPARGSDYQLYGLFYDGGKNIISRSQLSAASSTTEILGTAPVGTQYIKAFIYSSTGFSSAELNSIEFCLNKSDVSKNGQYEPYKRSVLDLHLDNIQVKSPNIWDEEWEAGGINNNSGEKDNTADRVRSKNLIPVSENGTYYIYLPSSYSSCRVACYDKDGVYLGASTGWLNVSNNSTFTTPLTTAYILFVVVKSGSTYNNDICINESSSFNGQYEPHGILTIKGLKQAGVVRDEIIGNKLIKRVETKIWKGNESWDANYNTIYTSFETKGTEEINISCNYYTAKVNSLAYVGTTGPNDLLICATKQGSHISIGDYTTYSTSAAWTTHLRALYDAGTPLTMNYAIPTPIEYEIVSPIPTAMPAGTTERRLPEDTSDSVLAPFACDMTYGTNPGDILASGIAWEKIWGRPQLAKGSYSDSVISGSGEWFKLDVGGQVLYVQFAVGTGAFKLKIADSDDEDAATVSKEFAFATLSESDINAICV